jgi:hypothetical protein
MNIKIKNNVLTLKIIDPNINEKLAEFLDK